MTIQYRRLMGVAVSNIKQNVGNLGLCLAAVSLLFLVTSCRKEVAAGRDKSPTPPATEGIAEGDTLYAGRGGLEKSRQGLIALRHAQATGAGNYDLAWLAC